MALSFGLKSLHDFRPFASRAMYKSSGKKYKGSSRDTSSGKYRTSGYSSDVTYRSDDEDDDSPRMYGNESPDYYPTGKRDYYSHQSGNKSSNYYPGKSQDYYSTGKSEYYPGNSKADYYTGGKSDFYTGGKHKGKEQPAYKMNKYQTIVLKVQIHCDACIRKVKKAIAEIDGVESISVDVKQKKVSVTGYLDPKKVLKKVAKTGKHVEMVSSKDSVNHMSNKAMIMSDHHMSSMSNMNNMSSKPYAIVEKSSRNHGNSHSMPYVMTPQVRSDADYMFSDENVNNCSIM